MIPHANLIFGARVVARSALSGYRGKATRVDPAYFAWLSPPLMIRFCRRLDIRILCQIRPFVLVDSDKGLHTVVGCNRKLPAT